MNYKTIILLFLPFLLQQNAFSQSDSSHKITFSGYIETYYSYDFSNPASHEKPNLFYSHSKHNEFNLNLGIVKAQYESARLRANLALMIGTYAQYNLSSESDVMRHVYEGNVGLKVSNKHDLWIDAGVFSSHIGFETAKGSDCWTLSRCLASEGSPYYEAGAKISYTNPNKKLNLTALLLNGWQHIGRPYGNNTPAFGTQLYYTPSDKATYNWSTFVGNEKPDTAKQWRFFNDFYTIQKLNDRFGLTLGFDYGMQQRESKSSKQDIWYSAQAILRMKISPAFYSAFRAEYYHDPKSVITGLSVNGARVASASLNVDYVPNIKGVKNVMFRNEFRTIYGRDAYFANRKGNSSPLWNAFTSSLLVDF